MDPTPDAGRPGAPAPTLGAVPAPRTALDARAQAALEMVAAFARSSDRSTRHAGAARIDELLDGHLDDPADDPGV